MKKKKQPMKNEVDTQRENNQRKKKQWMKNTITKMKNKK